MKLEHFETLRLRDSPLSYRRVYDLTAVLVLRSGRQLTCDAVATVEQQPVGPLQITVRVDDPPPAPMVQVIGCIKEGIKDLERQGQLPWE